MSSGSRGGRRARALPGHGVITLATLDLRRRPDHRSELRSQLLMGETVRILGSSAGGRWWRIENRDDAYVGWVRAWGLVTAGAARAARWRRKARARVVVTHLELREAPGRGATVSPLFWNGRVIPRRRHGSAIEVELPDGRRGWGPAKGFGSGRSRPRLSARLRGLLGIPYLWGGRTPLGFDCSAFVQQLLAEQGIAVPRDADQQHRSCHAVRADRLRQGDLIFFGDRGRPRGHVGIVLGGGYYAHVRGWVRINSLDESNPLCDRELLDTVRGFGRPGDA